MNLIEKSQKELEIDRNEFLLMRQKVATEKTAIQSMLVAVNLKLRVRLSRSDFLSLQNQRADLIRQQEEKEREIQELKAKQTEIQTVIDFKKSEGLQPSDVRNLTEPSRLNGTTTAWTAQTTKNPARSLGKYHRNFAKF